VAHPRKLIRHAVRDLLIAANTAAGARVKGTRVEPHKSSQLPAIGVYTLNDPIAEDGSTNTEQAHELELEVVGWVAHTEALPADDAMDDLAEQIEAAMNAEVADDDGPFLGGKVSEIRFVGTVMEVVEDNARTSPNVGIVVLTYAMTYRAGITAADPADDFETVDATHKIAGGVGNTVPAEDQFTVLAP